MGGNGFVGSGVFIVAVDCIIGGMEAAFFGGEREIRLGLGYVVGVGRVCLVFISGIEYADSNIVCCAFGLGGVFVACGVGSEGEEENFAVG